jgi:hypothetical protein
MGGGVLENISGLAIGSTSNFKLRAKYTHQNHEILSA